MKKFFILAFSVLVLAAFGYGAARFLQRDRELSERPPRAVAGGTATEKESVIAVQALIPHSALESAINRGFPSQISESGQGREKTFPARTFIGPGPVVYLDYTWSLLIERGPVHIAPAGNQLRATIPVSVSGWGGLQGALAHLVGLNKKNVRGAIELFLDVSADLSPDWEPVITAQPHFRWTQPAEIEVIGGVWKNVEGQVNGKINEAMASAAAQATAAMDKQAIRNALAREWRVRRLKLGTYVGQEALMTITPQAAGFSGLDYQPTGTAFAVSFKAKTQTTFAAPADGQKPDAPLPLPKLDHIPPQASDLRLDLPVYIAYDALRAAALAQAPASGFTGDSPLGRGTLWVRDLAVFPTTGNRLAVGVKLSAKFEHRYLNVNGWVWLTAGIAIDAANSSVAFNDVRFTRSLDSKVWSAVTMLLNQPMQSVLNHNTSVSFGGQLNAAREELQQTLREPKNSDGFKLSLRGPEISLSNLVLLDSSVSLTAQLRANAEVQIAALPLP